MQNANTLSAAQHGRPRISFAILSRATRWYRLRSSRRHLHMMSDKLLRDIGISRLEIDHATWHGELRKDLRLGW